MTRLKRTALVCLAVLPLAAGCSRYRTVTTDPQNNYRIVRTEPVMYPSPGPVYVPSPPPRPVLRPRVTLSPPPAASPPPTYQPAPPAPPQVERTSLTIERTTETRVIKRTIVP